MKSLIIILGLVFSTGNSVPENKENSNKSKTTAPAVKLLTNTYYKVIRKTGVPPRNSAEAEQIADVSNPYGNVAYLSNSACRTWWLNKSVVPGGDVTWSYYYSAGGTLSTTGNYFLLACPL